MNHALLKRTLLLVAVVGTLEVRKDRVSWRPADKEIWLDLNWDQLDRQWQASEGG